MSYVKWVANARNDDGVQRLLLEDGTEVAMGVPVNLGAELRKQLEEEGRVFEDSSADESKEVRAEQQQQPVGLDVAGTAPVLGDSGESNQQSDNLAGRESGSKSDKK